MVVAAIGPLTSLTQAVAAVVGAGMLLGGFASGAIGLLFSWSKPEFDVRVVRDGYIGGGVAVGFVVADVILRYAL